MVAPEGSPAAQLFVHPLLGIMPEANIVIILRIDTDGNWSDPGDALQMQLVSTIINARN